VFTPAGLASYGGGYSMTVRAVTTPLAASAAASGTGVGPVVSFAQSGLPAATVVPGLPIVATFTLTGASGTPTGNVVINLRNLSTNAVGGAGCTEAGAFFVQPLISGVTTCHINAPAAGNYNLEIVYAGDGTYSGSTGIFPLATAQLSPSSVLTPPLLAVVPAQPLTMSVTFTSTSPLGAPTGTIAFYLRNLSTNAFNLANCAEGGAFGSETLSAGSATCTFAAPNLPGSYRIEIPYNGDAQHLAVTPTFNTIVVSQVLPVFSLTGLPASTNAGQSLVITGSFASTSPLGPPSGTVAFYLRDQSTNVANLANCAEGGAFGSETLVSGSAVCTFNAPVAGTYKVEVPYAGDVQHLPLTGISPLLTVLASGPAFSPSPASLTFASQNVATTSAPQTLTILNSGNAVMSILSPSITGPFAVSANSCTGLMPMGTCTMSVTFTPTVAGAATGTLSIPTNAPGSPHAIALSGTGVTAGTPTMTVGFAPTSVPTATNAKMTLTLSNPNSSPAIISIGGVVSVPGLSMSGLVDGCGASASIGTGTIDLGMAGSIPALGSCTIDVQVQSATAGSFPVTVNPGNLVTSFGNNTNTSTATLTVTASVPALTLVPTSLNFGTRTVNTTSPASAVTLTNSGTAAAFLSSIVNTGDFAFTTTCPLFSAPLAAGSSCTISVTFTPLTAAAITGNVTITSSAPGSPHVITLAGTGAAVGVGNIAVNPVSLDFGTVTVGTGSAPAAVVVSNTGFANLLLSGVTITGPFVRVAQPAVPPDCGSSVAPGAACTISIAFTPAVVGTASGQLSLAHNATGSPSVVTLNGVATPVPVPVLSVAPRIAFGDQVLNVATSFNVSLANTGSADLSIGNLLLSGSTDFTLAGSCSVLTPGGACVVNLAFRPSGLGARSAQLDINSNSGTTTPGTSVLTSIPVSGNGILAPRPVAEVDVTGIGYGNSIFGGASSSRLVTLKSVGNSPLEIRNIFSTGSDFTQMNSCASSLPTNATCLIAVTFVPLGMGVKAGELQIVTNAIESPHRVQLSGTGCRWFSQTSSRFFLTTCGN
jgi:hypothetical protein